MSADPDGTLTPEEDRRVRAFRRVLSEIEVELKRRLKVPEKSNETFAGLISRYRDRNTCWAEEARVLHRLRLIRNFFVHGGEEEDGYPVTVSPRTLRRVEAILDSLVRPPLVSDTPRGPVTAVTSTDPLAAVLGLAFDAGYSQFPVVDAGRFRGVVTEHEIVRWLGNVARRDRPTVDLAEVTVEVVLAFRERERRDTPIFRFARLDTPLGEVLGMFASDPVLEVVLLTPSGDGRTPIEGIFTQWDAAGPRHRRREGSPGVYDDEAAG